MNIKQPIFMVGSERSGTTMLRLLLDHHPDIAFNLESMFLISQLSNDGSFPDMHAYRAWLASDRIFQHSHFFVDKNLDYKQLVNSFLTQKLGKKKHVGATVHYQFRKLNLLWPEAKYIYLVRDGRDVANSVKKIGFSGNDYESSKWWLQAEVEWEKAKENISDKQWIEVKYEQLTENPVQQLQRICEFIGVPFHDEMIHISTDSSYREPDPAYNYQWKKKMPQIEVQRIESLIGDRLVQRGYALSGLPRISVSAIGKKILSLDSKVNVYVYKVKKYGFLLTFGEIFARRFKLNGMQRRVAARVDQIIDRNLK